MALEGLLADYGDDCGSGSVSSAEKDGKTVESLRVLPSSGWSGNLSAAPIFVEKEPPCERLPEDFAEMKMTIGRVGRGIMSVELAMQRELAYRNKMESLQSPQLNGFKEPPMPVHEMPLDQKIVGIKIKEPSGSQSFLPPEHSGQAYIDQEPIRINPLNLFCKECEVLCSGESNLKQHYRGKKHQIKLEELARQKSSGKTWTGLLWCEICNIQCLNELCFRQHLSGKKHAICLQAINNAESARGKRAEEIPMASGKQFHEDQRRMWRN